MQPQKISPGSRDQYIDSFLAQSGWGNATRNPIPGDASFRRYERITHGSESAILMDAPPEKEDVKPFIFVAEYLVNLNFRAPRILAKDIPQGLLLLEDLGNDLFSRVLAGTSEAGRAALESELYLAATDLQAELFARTRASTLPSLPAYDTALLNRELSLVTEWYLPAIAGKDATAKLVTSYEAVWAQALATLPALPSVPVLRDYHADNLLVLPNACGIDSVGLLDFQDAVLGSPAYDMVSFLEDARRDVSPETVAACKSRYLAKTGLDTEAFETAYAILGAQRNCKIIGIFTRLGVRDGKYRYQHYLPRVWGHLRHDLKHPALAPVAAWVKEHIPAQWQQGAYPFPDRA